MRVKKNFKAPTFFYPKQFFTEIAKGLFSKNVVLVTFYYLRNQNNLFFQLQKTLNRLIAGNS